MGLRAEESSGCLRYVIAFKLEHDVIICPLYFSLSLDLESFGKPFEDTIRYRPICNEIGPSGCDCLRCTGIDNHGEVG
jgi:hypothetical protein